MRRTDKMRLPRFAAVSIAFQRISSSFFEKKFALRSVPRLPAFSGQFDTHSVRSIFSDVHAAGENGFDLFFAVRGEKLCEAFLIICKVAKS